MERSKWNVPGCKNARLCPSFDAQSTRSRPNRFYQRSEGAHNWITISQMAGPFFDVLKCFAIK